MNDKIKTKIDWRIFRKHVVFLHHEMSNNNTTKRAIFVWELLHFICIDPNSWTAKNGIFRDECNVFEINVFEINEHLSNQKVALNDCLAAIVLRD